MVKVKAYVSEVARLIVDKEESIAQRAVDLFEEISQKGERGFTNNIRYLN